MKDLIITIIIVVATVGPCAVIAMIGFASINALGKKPSQAPRILKRMIFLLVSATVLSIAAMLLVLVFLVK